MLDIYTYINNSDNKVVDKNLEEIIKLQGDFRYENSVINPSIDIEASFTYGFEFGLSYTDSDIDYDVSVDIDNEDIDISYNVFGVLSNINYIYIPLLNRYYYVTDIILLNNNMFRFICSEDVLMSLKEQFKPLYALISRAERFYDVDLDDDKMTYLYKTIVEENDIDYSDNDIEFYSEYGNRTSSYAITFYNDSIPRYLNYTYKPENNLNDISSSAVAYNTSTIVGFMEQYDVITLCKDIYMNDNLTPCITSLVAFPFIPKTLDTQYQLRLNTTNISNCYYKMAEDNSMMQYYKLGSFIQYSYINGYLSKEPYTKYELYLPYFGYCELKSSDILDCLINIYYCINYCDGSCKIIIYNHTKDYVIKSLNGTIGVKVAFTRSNQQQLNDEKIQLGIKSSLSVLGSVASIVGGVATASVNPASSMMVASGVTGLIGTGADIISKVATMHEMASASINSGVEGLYDCQRVRLKTIKMVKNEPNDYASFYGRPLNKTMKLSNITGFVQVADIHLDNLECTNNEKNILLANLKEGIIL